MAKVWLFILCGVLWCGSTCFCASQASNKESQLDLSDLPSVLNELVRYHPGKRVVDEEVLLRSHEKLFSLFDGEKIYLLEKEVAEYLNPKNGKRFLLEYQKKNFSAYFKILDICHRAVQRSRSIRSGFFFTDTQTIDSIRNSQKLTYDHYAEDIDDLQNRVFHHYVRLVAKRLDPDEEGESEKVKNAVMLAEKELEANEKPWLEFSTQRGISKERGTLTARVILKSILSALDAHSDVMGERGARDIRERLTKEAFGTGVVAGISEEGCFVKKVIKGSPADRLGTIKVHDRILSLDGRPCSEMLASEIESALNKESTAMVVLTLKRSFDQKRGEETLFVTIPRRRYTMQEGRLEIETRKTPQGKIAILTLHSFYRGGSGVSSSEDMKRAFHDEKATGPIAGVILDLRDNGGGYVTEAVRVVGEFINTGVVMAASYADGSKLVFRDLEPGAGFTGPMIVLTSKATASAAEIVAQALKDYGRAIIVGDPSTYGKGSIQMQTVTDMSEKQVWANIPLRLTIGRFYTVSGYSPQLGGVTADIVVPGVYERTKTEEERGDGRLKERIDPMYRDSLDDVRLEARGWYQENYLPFVQKTTNQYRRLIPTLKANSEQRMKQNVLWSIFNYRPVSPEEKEAVRRKVNELQMNEAVAIEEDLIRLSSRTGKEEASSAVERKGGE